MGHYPIYAIIFDPIKQHLLYYVLLGCGHRKEGRLQQEQRPQALEVSHRRPQVDRGQEVLWQVLYRQHQPLWNQVRFCQKVAHFRTKKSTFHTKNSTVQFKSSIFHTKDCLFHKKKSVFHTKRATFPSIKLSFSS